MSPSNDRPRSAGGRLKRAGVTDSTVPISAPRKAEAADRPAPSSGHLPVLAGRFRMLNIIGYGSYGLVFRGKNLVSGESVAIKILKSDNYGDDFIETQWAREQRLAGQLQIDGAPRGLLHGDEKVQGSRVSYLVTELIKGQNLKEWRRALEEPPRPLLVHDITRRIVEALCELRELGVVHRDIKPGNIMRTDEGAIKIMDFGLHRRADDPRPESSDKTVGTPQYLPPEMIAGDPGGFAGDIYSLACTLYFIVTGKAAFDGKSVKDVLLKHRRGKFPRLPGAWAASAFDKLLRRMGARDPDRRPSIAQVRELLGRIDPE